MRVEQSTWNFFPVFLRSTAINAPFAILLPFCFQSIFSTLT
jgi:hypothetical protein